MNFPPYSGGGRGFRRFPIGRFAVNYSGSDGGRRGREVGGNGLGKWAKKENGPEISRGPAFENPSLFVAPQREDGISRFINTSTWESRRRKKSSGWMTYCFHCQDGLGKAEEEISNKNTGIPQNPGKVSGNFRNIILICFVLIWLFPLLNTFHFSPGLLGPLPGSCCCRRCRKSLLFFFCRGWMFVRKSIADGAAINPPSLAI